MRGLQRPPRRRRAGRPRRLRGELLRVARGHQGGRRARAARPRGPARQGGGGERQDRLRGVPGDLLRRGVGAACAAAGANVQRPLWASTSTKNPDYPDTLYVDELIGPDTVNTMPDATIEAARDHATPERTVDRDVDGARELDATSCARSASTFDDIVCRQLVDEGVESFAKSYDSLLETLAAEGRRAVGGGALGRRSLGRAPPARAAPADPVSPARRAGSASAGRARPGRNLEIGRVHARPLPGARRRRRLSACACVAAP